MNPYRPLYVEVPVEIRTPRFGVLDMTGLAPLFKSLYPATTPNSRAPGTAPVPMSGTPQT